MSPEWIAFGVIGVLPLVAGTLGFQVLRRPGFLRSMWAVLGLAAFVGLLGLAGLLPSGVSVGASVLVMIPLGQAVLWTVASGACNRIAANGTEVGTRAQLLETVTFVVLLLFAFIVRGVMCLEHEQRRLLSAS
jgi:hypothetical protein